MPTKPDTEDKRRPCSVCFEVRQIVGKVGPLEIKEPCPNRCAKGYAREIGAKKNAN